jgi:hypothetical protein
MRQPNCGSGLPRGFWGLAAGRAEVGVDLAGDVTLQAADDLRLGFPFGHAAFGVGAGARADALAMAGHASRGPGQAPASSTEPAGRPLSACVSRLGQIPAHRRAARPRRPPRCPRSRRASPRPGKHNTGKEDGEAPAEPGPRTVRGTVRLRVAAIRRTGRRKRGRGSSVTARAGGTAVPARERWRSGWPAEAGRSWILRAGPGVRGPGAGALPGRAVKGHAGFGCRSPGSAGGQPARASPWRGSGGKLPGTRVADRPAAPPAPRPSLGGKPAGSGCQVRAIAAGDGE